MLVRLRVAWTMETGGFKQVGKSVIPFYKNEQHNEKALCFYH